MLKPSDLYPRELSSALSERGEYVYAYYEDDSNFPFYIGKGVGARALDHWKKAISSPEKEHEQKIRKILENGNFPQIKLLAYNLENTEEKTYNVVERVLQDAFGIQSVWQKMGGSERLESFPASLLQKREDSSKYPCLSLDAVLSKSNNCGQLSADSLRKISAQEGLPILVVGLSETYHPKYNQGQLAEMARMYWSLEKYKNTSLPNLLAGKAYLLAWSSKNFGRPMIVGAWTIDGNRATTHGKSKRYEFPLVNSYKARKIFIGKSLEGTGNNWQGPKIYL